ncbi:hypothetical protein Halru_0702 [Halovivax ruber XH-70]|uniref:Geranylgeranyl pyrophosphate synthase n=1 Tax=Halovivax ruber (strain DSM 18193 / JCM 13892 / XH-70) TaxID=797302 RepID=L0I9F8_HALRX|nr:hypothetical protein [Halovivax ruber]AGB15329.1 hypothetical protein Halru_0702 [Halovivax ruber XH-70]
MMHLTDHTDRRAAIDQSIEHALPSDPTGCLAPADAQMDAFEDRWYGRLVFVSAAAGQAGDAPAGDVPDSTTGAAFGDETGSTAGAAAAIELLRGYCSLRYALLCDGDDRSLESVTPELLSSDYLFAAAFERLGDSVTSDDDTARLESCFETLAGTAERSIEAMATDVRRSPSPDAYADVIGETAGALGWWAARTGAVLAGSSTGHRQTIASIGRLASVHRQLRHVLDPSTVPGPVTPFPGVECDGSAPGDADLRRLAGKRRDEVLTAIESLPATIDATALRSLVRADSRR